MPQPNIDQKSRKLFFDALSKLSKEDLSDFVVSLLSSAEIKDISRRLMIAKFLKENYTYEMIADLMGCSESTVGKIHTKTYGSPSIHKGLKSD